MENEEKIIKIINEIDNLVGDAVDEGLLLSSDMYDDLFINNYDVLDEFSDKLDKIINDELDNELLEMISKIKYCNIFKCQFGFKYKNNINRIKIAKYLNEKKMLCLNYDLVKKFIRENYRLAEYINDFDKLIELSQINEKVILCMKNPSLDFVESMLKKSEFISKVFLGMYGQNNALYQYSNYYKKISKLDMINFDNLKDILVDNPTLFIQASDVIKNNKLIQKLMIDIDFRYESYFS